MNKNDSDDINLFYSFTVLSSICALR
jgi:hypothetical protein